MNANNHAFTTAARLAFARGEAVQYIKPSTGKWTTVTNPKWNPKREYRPADLNDTERAQIVWAFGGKVQYVKPSTGAWTTVKNPKWNPDRQYRPAQ